jgi:mannose-6-phosphate isomerase-like protein (cupin superfamily)
MVELTRVYHFSAAHRLANPGDVPMALIEVQYGDYLGEDDIERLEDDYRRSPRG